MEKIETLLLQRGIGKWYGTIWTLLFLCYIAKGAIHNLRTLN